MVKIIKAQATITKDSGQQMQQHKKTVQINPYHPFMSELLERVKSGVDAETEEQANVLYQVALLQAGFELKNPSHFIGKFYQIMKDSFGISRDVQKVDVDLTEFEEEEQNNE